MRRLAISLRRVSPARTARAFHASPLWLDAEKAAVDADADAEAEPALDAEPAAAAADDDDASVEADAEPEVSEVDTLKAESAALRDQVLRTLAEMENLRKRTEKDVASARNFAVQCFAKSLLDVADNMDRALENTDMEAAKEDALPALEMLVDGVTMTRREMEKAFEKNGLNQFGAVGDAFDPNLHECMFMMPNPDLEPNTIAQLLKPGFMLKERVLRAAQVGVCQAP